MADQMRQRHGCLTAWLILMIIANSLTSLMYLFGSRARFRNAPDWAFPALAILSMFNIVCAIALFKWKKWGFFGFAGTSLIVFVFNLAIGLPIVQALFGLAGFVILYGVLHFGKENKAWPRLE